MGYFETAQICLNGHCINSSVNSHPDEVEEYCHICGSKTITTCPSCDSIIRGRYCDENYTIAGIYSAPAYCHNCGKPYPWTATALEAAAELIQEDEQLPTEQKNALVSSLPDLLVENPRTQLAGVRFKKALANAGKFTAEGLRQFAIDFACEATLKMLGMK